MTICIGFTDEVLPYLLDAIANKHVDWVENGYYGEEIRQFDYLGFRYSIRGNLDNPTSVIKIGRLNVMNDDGDTEFVREESVVGMRSVQVPEAYNSWGDF